MEFMFLLGIHHVARIRRIRCRMGPAPPPLIDFLPPDKIPYGKSSPSMGFLPPPPSQNKPAHAVPIVHMEFVFKKNYHRGGSSPMGFHKACHMILFPWGSSAMVFLPGEGLLHGIPSGGTFAI